MQRAMFNIVLENDEDEDDGSSDELNHWNGLEQSPTIVTSPICFNTENDEDDDDGSSEELNHWNGLE